MKIAVRYFSRSGNTKKLALAIADAVASSTYKLMQKIAGEQGVALAEEEFHCRGAFAVMHRSRPNAKDLQNAAAFAKSVTNR